MENNLVSISRRYKKTCKENEMLKVQMEIILSTSAKHHLLSLYPSGSHEYTLVL